MAGKEKFEVSLKEMKRVARDHIDLLQNVEFTITNTFRENPKIDDALVAQALRALIKAKEPEDDLAVELVGTLLDVEELRADVDDRLWRDVYRVVLDSVHNHSTLLPGNRGYLNFVGGFIV